MALEGMTRGNLEAVPASEASLLVWTLSPRERVGEITVADDGRFEATHATAGFAGVHKTLSEALAALEERVP